ncbi:Spx/MgsR family RNA polymerase-binding regulatory protein [Pleurocapsales cyanobacterium LEGE 10410]|nr:Spx/MgsR family RNA polymerase-binding regulatory protein [Pleurocapsales cyanobacterium LEGE 10410]
MPIEVYGIPNCGTCKKAIAWLQNNNVDYKFVNLKNNPPSKAEIASWVKTLGSKPMRNTSGRSYRALGEQRNTWTDRDWIDAFAQDAMLLKRPLFVKGDRAVLVGFKASETEIKEKLGVS